MPFWTNIRKAPKRGVLALKAPPGGQKPSFFRVNRNTFMFITSISRFWQNFIKIWWMDEKLRREGYFGQFGAFRAFKPMRDAVSVPKKVNDDVSCNDICKFEFSTIKRRYSDIHNAILDKHQKKPQKGVFLALKAPGGHEPEFFRGQQ